MKPLGVAATLSACGAGCALFDTGGWSAAGLGASDRQTLLKPIGEAPQALRLEYVIVERPVGDPLLGSQLWDEMTEMGVVEPKVRQALNEQGLRVGVTNASPPEALRKLLGETKEITDARTPEEAQRRHGMMQVLPSGGSFAAWTSDEIPTRTVTLTAGGETNEKTFGQARGIVTVTAKTEQEGWAKLTFLPEIHHGNPELRHSASEGGWQFTSGQNVQKLFDQTFELTMNEGDTAVVTCLGDLPDRAGDLFFRTEAAGVPVQRLLVVRLVRAGETPVRSEAARDL